MPTFIESFRELLQDADAIQLGVGLAIILLVFLLRRPLANWAVVAVSRLAEAISIPLSEPVRESLVKPSRTMIVSGIALLVARSALPQVPVSDVVERILASVLIVALFGIWYQLADTLVATLSPQRIVRVRIESGWAVRVTRLVIIVAAFAAVLGQWNVDIGSALTGVGVFGAGIAIASQDLIRNLMAGVSNMSEERFETGDWIEVVGVVEGIVRRVDLRSTTILGFDRVPHYMPNAELSNAVVRNLTRRDYRRVFWKIGLVLDTSDAQLDRVSEGLSDYLVQSGDFVVSDDIRRIVHVDGLSDSSVDLTIYAYSVTNRYEAYSEICDRLTREILRLVRDAGTELAYPTQTLYVENPPTG